MPVSKTAIPLDDEETIRRFTEEIRRRSTPSLPSLHLHVETFESTIIQRSGDSHVEHRATQTEPVHITPANGGPHSKNAFLGKPKSMLDSVLLQSPPGNGIMAPPSTPETRPGFTNLEISQLIIENIESLPATSTFTLGQSRHAPRHRSTNEEHETNMRESSANDHVSSSMLSAQMSQADRIVRNQSFPRLSFKAAESSTITASMTSPAPVSFSIAESSPEVLKATSPPPGSPDTIASSTDSMAEIPFLSVLEKPFSSSRWAYPKSHPKANPAPEPTIARQTALKTWNSFAAIAGDIKEKTKDASLDSAIGSISHGTTPRAGDIKEKPEEASPDSANGSISQGTAAIAGDTKETPEEASSGSAIVTTSQGTAQMALSANEQVGSPVTGDTVKPTEPQDTWLPPHLRTSDYASKDPRIVKPNRSYLNKKPSNREVPSEGKKPSTDGSVTEPVAEVPIALAEAITSPDDSAPCEPVLSPSSIVFQPVSPPNQSGGTKEDRREQLYFSAWGKPEHRLKAAAKVRKAIIKLSNPTPSLVASLVWGGIIEEIHVKSSSADVLFAYAEDLQNYFEATANGIKYKKDGRDIVAVVEKGRDVDVVSGQLCNYLEQGFTRCVRAVDILDKFTPEELRMKAGFKNRKVEGIDVGQTEAGLRYVVFRFCSISHAVTFKQALVRDEEWEHCNVHYIPDPCAQANGVHV